MKTFRLAFLLGILSTSLIGCGNGGGNITHTFTFEGTNCEMHDASGKLVTSTTIKDNDSVEYTISVDTEQYKLPTSIFVNEGKFTDYSYSVETGKFKIEHVKEDIAVTAQGILKTDYTITYPRDPNATWKGPASIKPNSELTAYVFPKDGFHLNKEQIHLVVDGYGRIDDDFGYSDNTLTLSSEYVVGDVKIFGEASPDVPPTSDYEVDFKISNATQVYIYPEIRTYNEGLYLEFKVDDNYRFPIWREEDDPKNSEIIITKYAPGVIHKLSVAKNEFLYGTYYSQEYSKTFAYIYVYSSVIAHNKTTKIEITGAAVEQAEVTFKVGEGHWPSGDYDTKDKYARVDKGVDTLEVAASKCGANATPIVDNQALTFDGWYDDKQQKIDSSTVITADLDVTAKFKYKEFSIFTTGVTNAVVTLPKTEGIHWHEAISGGKIAANTNYKLPNRSDIQVWSGLPSQGTNITEKVTYTLNDTSTEADFAIPENTIEDNVYIILDAYKTLTVTFSPGEGKWRDGGTATKSVEIKEGMTYQEALNKAATGGNPMKDGGYTFDGWYNGNVKIIDMNVKVPAAASPVNLTAKYAQGKLDFANDSWANIIKYSEAGLESLWENYGTTMYLGAERTLHYKSPYTNAPVIDYKVRLIDYNSHDTIAGSTKKATLTFEFVNLIGDGKYGVIEGQQYSHDNNWSKSLYRKFLFDFYKVLIGNDPDTSTALNPGFAAKQVVKSTMCVDDPAEGEPSWYLVDTDEYLFPLSGSEIGIHGTNHLINSTSYNEDEGIIYDYYWYETQHRTVNTPMAKKFLNSTTSEATDKYWLRSPHTVSEAVYTKGEPDTSGSYVIKWVDQPSTYEVPAYSGVDFDRMSSGDGCGYMAAFCI